MINTLRKLFNQILSEENEDFDLRDRTIFYCKALQTNIDGLKKATEENANLSEMFVEEFETFSVFINLKQHGNNIINRKEQLLNLILFLLSSKSLLTSSSSLSHT